MISLKRKKLNKVKKKGVRRTMSNNNNKPSINTRSLQFYNVQGFSSSTVVLSLWNDVFVSIKISNAKKVEEQTNGSVFDYDNGIVTAVPVNKIYDLLAGLDKIKEAYKDNIDASIYVSISGNNLIGYGTRNIDGRQVYYLAIHKGLNEDKIPEISAYYEFNSGFNIENYDPSSGNSTSNLVDDTEFSIFISWLKDQITAASKAVAHSVKVVLDYNLNRIENKLNVIGSAVGARYSENKNKRKELFDKPTQENTKPEVEYDEDDVPF